MIAPRIAAPRTPPTMRSAWRTPDETPLLSSETAPRAVSIVAGRTRPSPSPRERSRRSLEIAARDAGCGAERESCRQEGESECRDHPRAGAGDESVGERSATSRPPISGKANAASLRVRAVHDLEVERHREQQSEHGERDDGAERCAPGELPGAEEAQVDERSSGPARPDEKAGERERPGAHLCERGGVGHASLAGADDAVGQEREPAAREGNTDEVDPLTDAASALGQQERRPR